MSYAEGWQRWEGGVLVASSEVQLAKEPVSLKYFSFWGWDGEGVFCVRQRWRRGGVDQFTHSFLVGKM